MQQAWGDLSSTSRLVRERGLAQLTNIVSNDAGVELSVATCCHCSFVHSADPRLACRS